MKKIILFANKNIGYELSKYLFKNFKNDNYILYTKKNNLKIIDLCKKYQVLCKIINKNNIIDLKKNNFKSYNWLINLWSDYIFDKDILKLFENTINIHPSFLPYCKGSDPIVWTIINEFQAGVTLHSINTKVDSGKIYCQKKIKSNFPIKGKDLYSSVFNESVFFFKQNWEKIRNGKFKNLNNNSPKKIYKRNELIKNQTIDINEDIKIKKFILKALAYDFNDDFKLKIKYKNKEYFLSLNLEKIV